MDTGPSLGCVTLLSWLDISVLQFPPLYNVADENNGTPSLGLSVATFKQGYYPEPRREDSMYVRTNYKLLTLQCWMT